jgi:hypothetical protein
MWPAVELHTEWRRLSGLLFYIGRLDLNGCTASRDNPDTYVDSYLLDPKRILTWTVHLPRKSGLPGLLNYLSPDDYVGCLITYDYVGCLITYDYVGCLNYVNPTFALATYLNMITLAA